MIYILVSVIFFKIELMRVSYRVYVVICYEVKYSLRTLIACWPSLGRGILVLCLESCAIHYLAAQKRYLL